MFRCRVCNVRMFERDCAGHLARHGLTVAHDQVAGYFIEGPRDALGRPGDNHKSTYAAPRRGRSVKPAGDDESDILN